VLPAALGAALAVAGAALPVAGQALVLPSERAAVGAGADSLPSVTLPPALARVLRDYERAWLAGDAAALAALFAEDGFVLQGGRPPVRGRAAIQAAYAGQGGAPLRLRALAYATGDTVGYIIGAYGYAPEQGDIGKFTLTLRRAPNGRWLIASDMDNMSRPARRMTAPGAPPA
jgi:ketosteroid isomerase-like protein